MRIFFAVVLAAVLGTCAFAYRWVNAPLELATSPVDLSIESGSSARDVANAAAKPKAGKPLDQLKTMIAPPSAF